MKFIVLNSNYKKNRATVALTLLAAICIECGGRNEPYLSTDEIHIASSGVENNAEISKPGTDSLEDDVRIKQALPETSPFWEEAKPLKSPVLNNFLSLLRQDEKFQIVTYRSLPLFSPLNDAYRESHVLFVISDKVLYGCVKTSVEQNVSNKTILAENDLVCHRMPESLGHIENIEAEVKNDGTLTISFCAGVKADENRKESGSFCYRWQPAELVLRRYGRRSVPLDTSRNWIQNWSQPPTAKEWWPYKAAAKILTCTPQEFTLALSPEVIISAVNELPINSINWVSSSSEPTQKAILIALSDENDQEKLIVKIGSKWSVLPWEKQHGLLKAWVEDAESMAGLSKSIWLFQEWHDSGSESGGGELEAVLYVPAGDDYRKAGNLKLGVYRWEWSSSDKKKREIVVSRSFDSFSVVESGCIQMRVEARWSAKYPLSFARRPVTNIEWMGYDFERYSNMKKTPPKGDIRLLHWTGKEFLPGCERKKTHIGRAR
ncbi:MAG: hypothetical protein JXX14_18950 [Deltaproteobacteria bacterium]|nr:hypothetical protein [Deltaproteobacteria bacterium]